MAIALRTAWNTHRDIGTKITNFAHLVQKQLTDTDDEEYEDYDDLLWSVSVNEEALYHQGQFFAKFKVRELLHTYIVRLFSHKNVVVAAGGP